MLRYALQYGQDGPVRYWMRQNRKTLVKGEIAGVSVALMRTDGGDLRTLLAGH
jgi:hypothetical protein